METKKKTVKEILSMDTSNMTLEEMISMLDSNGKNFADDVLQLRLKHEEDTGVAMENDEIAEQENEYFGKTFKEIVDRL